MIARTWNRSQLALDNALVGTAVWPLAWKLLLTAAFAFAVPLVVYVSLFAGIPAVHDTLHELRHGFLNIQCH